MNEDIFAGQWQQMRGALKSWWGRLTDDDFERIGGQKDKLIGLIQEKYGHTRDRAQQEVDRRLNEYDDKLGDASGSRRPDAAAGTDMKASAYELGAIAASKVSEAATTVASGLETASSYLQEKKFKNMAADFTDLLRNYPVQSLLIGVGLGYLLARSWKG